MITTPVQHHVMGQDNEKEDDQHSPHTPRDIVTNQLPPIPAIKKTAFKYRVRRPPPSTKEVTTDGRLAEAVGGEVMAGPPRDRPEDAPDATQPDRGSSSLTQEKKTCGYRKGGVCKEHGPGAKER